MQCPLGPEDAHGRGSVPSWSWNSASMMLEDCGQCRLARRKQPCTDQLASEVMLPVLLPVMLPVMLPVLLFGMKGPFRCCRQQRQGPEAGLTSATKATVAPAAASTVRAPGSAFWVSSATSESVDAALWSPSRMEPSLSDGSESRGSFHGSPWSCMHPWGGAEKVEWAAGHSEHNPRAHWHRCQNMHALAGKAHWL